MTRRITAIAMPLTAFLVVGLLAAAAPANAIYIATPLHLNADSNQANVGDSLGFRITPSNESEAAAGGGATVRVEYSWDAAAEGENPEEPTDSSSMQTRTLLESLKLGDDATASFEWTIPAEVDDRNVDVRLVSADGESLGFAYVAVGDAPPMYRLAASSGPGALEGGEQPEPAREDLGSEDGAGAGADDAKSNVPSVGAIAIVGTLGVLAYAVARRK